MDLLQFLVFCTLAACCVAQSPPGPPLPTQPPYLRLSPRNCNDSEVVAVARFALQSINIDQKDGYTLSLSQVHDVWEDYQEDMGSLFYLTLDVLESECHVLSKKELDDCHPRIYYDSVYGQCKAMFHINKPRRVLHLLAYNCTLRPVPRRKIDIKCPGCPVPVMDLSSPDILEAARLSLEKFNSESPSKQYSLIRLTRATNESLLGPAYFVEYLIKESPCTKSQASCSLQPSDSEPDGFCQGSVLPEAQNKKFVTAHCGIFKSQAQVPGGENSAVTQEPKKLPKVDAAPQKSPAPTSSPSITAPRGSVQRLPDLSVENPEDFEGKSPEEALPVHLDLTTNPQGETLDVSFLYLGPEEKKLLVLPFPRMKQLSAECPGPLQNTNPYIFP